MCGLPPLSAPALRHGMYGAVPYGLLLVKGSPPFQFLHLTTMILRYARLALCLFMVLLFVPGALATDADGRLPRAAVGDLVCRPFGECEPCPPNELDQPFCMPYGNRRLLHCQKPGEKGKGEVPAWEACGKVIATERRDFWEFVTCNLLFLIVALAILWARTSALTTQQYRQLAARIGIPGGSWR